jgi:hypothetical protein
MWPPILATGAQRGLLKSNVGMAARPDSGEPQRGPLDPTRHSSNQGVGPIYGVLWGKEDVHDRLGGGGFPTRSDIVCIRKYFSDVALATGARPPH